jgi:polar amino acid transport system substrate-binding protein
VAQTGTTLLDLANDVAAQCKKDGAADVTVQQYAKASDLIQQLVVGRADAAVTQDIEASFRESQAPGEFEVGYAYPDKETFGVYFPPDNPELGQAIHDGLAQMEADGTLAQIAEDEGFPAEGIGVEDIEGNVQAP